MKSGKQILRIYFEGGEINVGRLTFTFDAPLNFAQPIADAGPNQIVQLPQTTTQLVGAGSSTGGSGSLQYSWKQIYGPSVLSFSNDTLPNPVIQTLADGVYLLELTVQNGAYSDVDEVYIISSTTNNVAPKVSIIYPSNNQTFIEQELIDIKAIASDLNDSVVQVDFSINNNLQSTSFQPPHTSLWQPTPGNYSLVATAKDGLGDSTQSSVVTITVSPAPPCDGVSWDGDFGYRFSPAENNPTLTFIPSLAGMGSPTCILYYGTDPGNMPGYIVAPNVPFTINATKGSRIYLYYTYSYPGAGEKNNAANKNSYVVGTCKNIGTENFISQGVYLVYPNPVRDLLFLSMPKGPTQIQVFSAQGHIVYSVQTTGEEQQIDMAAYSSGLYLVTITNTEGTTYFKVVKSNE
jgi:hypothetical protein